jgi:hypothetical protein
MCNPQVGLGDSTTMTQTSVNVHSEVLAPVCGPAPLISSKFTLCLGWSGKDWPQVVVKSWGAMNDDTCTHTHTHTHTHTEVGWEIFAASPLGSKGCSGRYVPRTKSPARGLLACQERCDRYTWLEYSTDSKTCVCFATCDAEKAAYSEPTVVYYHRRMRHTASILVFVLASIQLLAPIL